LLKLIDVGVSVSSLVLMGSTNEDDLRCSLGSRMFSDVHPRIDITLSC
jgi:hypothetical protein